LGDVVTSLRRARQRRSVGRPEDRESAADHRVGPPTALLDRFDREIIELLLSWAAYGDPPDDDLIIRFGIPGSQLKSHVAQLLERSIDSTTDPLDRTLLVRIAKLLGRAPTLGPAPVAVVGQTPPKPLNYAAASGKATASAERQRRGDNDARFTAFVP
jgi:hypothetical protein